MVVVVVRRMMINSTLLQLFFFFYCFLSARANGLSNFTTGTAICTGCFESASHCDWPPTAVDLVTPTLSPFDDAQCAGLCLVNTDCTHYTFSVLQIGGSFLCRLKQSNVTLLPIPATIGLVGSTCGRILNRSPPSYSLYIALLAQIAGFSMSFLVLLFVF